MLFAEGFTFRNFLIDVFGIGVLVPSKVTSKSHLRVIAAFLKSRDQRKRVEMRFAHLKIHHGFERMRLRGLSGARDEFLLAATVQNLKTLALRLLGQTTRPAARMVCLRSLMLASVASASRSPPIKRPQNSPAGISARSNRSRASAATKACHFQSSGPGNAAYEEHRHQRDRPDEH
jgi:hypothetical protein